LQPAIVLALRRCGHEVYDFKKNPAPGKVFAWSDIDPNWQNWTAEELQCGDVKAVALLGDGVLQRVSILRDGSGQARRGRHARQG
jgi:hypothetical protein